MTALSSPAFAALSLRWVLGFALGMMAVSARADEAAPTRSDRFGDPLPAGALARLGTVRFRGTAEYVAFSPDGKMIATAGFGGTAYLWDAVNGKLLHRIKWQYGTHALAVSPRGDRSAVAGGSVGLFDTTTGKQVRELNTDRRSGPISALAFSPDGKMLITGTYEDPGPIMAWDVATGRYLRTFGKRSGSISSLAYSPDGKYLASSGRDLPLCLWDPGTGVERGQLKGHEDSINSLVIAGGGKLLVSGGKDQTIRVWDVAARKEVHRLAEKHGGVSALAITPDGGTLASGNDDGTIGLWDIGKRQELRHWQASRFSIVSMVFSPDGRTLVSSSQLELCPRRWDVATGRELGVRGGHRSMVNWLSFSADGRQLYSQAYENEVLRWDLRTGREEPWFRWPREHHEFALLSPDEKTALTEADSHQAGSASVRLWDTATGKPRHDLGRFDIILLGAFYQPAAFSPDGKLLAVGSTDGTVILWETATGKERGRQQKHKDSIINVAFAPDGKGLAASTIECYRGERSLRYWDLTTGKDRCDFHYQGRVNHIVFAPDGKVLATAGPEDDESGRKSHFRLWDTTTGKQLRIRDPSEYSVCALAISPDGRFLAVGRETYGSTFICVREMATGQEVCRFRDPSGYSLCFAPDGRSLAASGDNSAILLWDLTGRQNDDGLQSAVLTERQLASSWQELAETDAGRAYRAAWLLVSAGERTAAYLQHQWRALLAVDEKKIARRIAELDSEQFAVREQATAELEKHSPVVLPALQRAVEGGPSLELRRRIEQIRAKLEEGPLLRMRRLVFVLEQLGSPAARQLLQDIADRKLDDRLTQEVKTALQPLSSPRGAKP